MIKHTFQKLANVSPDVRRSFLIAPLVVEEVFYISGYIFHRLYTSIFFFLQNKTIDFWLSVVSISYVCNLIFMYM